MLDLGLSWDDRRTFEKGLAYGHEVTVEVHILDENENAVSSFVGELDMVASGAVQVDATAPVTRSLSITLSDDDGRLHVDSESPSSYAVSAGSSLSVIRRHHIVLPARPGRAAVTLGWVEVPCFLGPLMTAGRDGAAVTLTAQGKESRALKPAITMGSRKLPKGMLVIDAIKDLMGMVGEKRFHLPGLDATLPKDIHIPRQSELWPVVRRLARSVKHIAFYDGRGYLRLREMHTRTAFTFRQGDLDDVGAEESPPTVVGNVKYTFDWQKMRNTFVILGPTPKKGDAQIRYEAVPPASHPLSPIAMARHGSPRHLVEVVTNDHLKSMDEAKQLGDHLLHVNLTSMVDVSLDSYAVDHLEEWDGARAIGRTGRAEYDLPFYMKQFTIPLTADTLMSVGGNRPVRRFADVARRGRGTYAATSRRGG